MERGLQIGQKPEPSSQTPCCADCRHFVPEDTDGVIGWTTQDLSVNPLGACGVAPQFELRKPSSPCDQDAFEEGSTEFI